MATRRTAGTRARDSDRTEICQFLDSALVEGQLSMEEHRQRVSAATNAATLGQLQSLIDDLQISTQPQPLVTRPSKLGSPAVVFAAIAAGVAVLLGAVAWAVIGNDDAATPTTAPSPTAVPEKHALAAEPTIATPESTTPEAPQEPSAVVLAPVGDLHTAEGITRVIDEIRNRFGDTTGYELAIMPDEAMLARPDPTNDQQKLIYSFESGWGDPSDRPRSDTDDVTDLAAFDVPAAAAALAAAPETLKIAPGDVSATFIDVDHIAEPPGPGALELLIKVTTTDGKDGWIYLDPAGNIKRVEDPS